MNFDPGDQRLEDYNPDVDGQGERDWSRLLTRIVNAAFFMFNLSLLYLLLSFIM